MDRDNDILAKILRAAEQGTLSKRKWQIYGCKSEDEMQAYLDGLITANAIIQHTKPDTAAKGGRGDRKLITWENEPYYSITSSGKADLKRLSS